MNFLEDFTDQSDDLNLFNLLKEDLKVLLGGLKKKFIQKELEIKDKEEGIKRFKEILKESKLKDINGILYNLNRARIVESNGGLIDLFDNRNLISNLFLIYNHENRKNEFEKDLKEINEKIKKKVIEEAYKNENWKENLKKIIKEIENKGEGEEIYEILKGIEKDEEGLREVIEGI
ncbi:hypothetical protein NBO_42g0013 [Nosema bombycis CQ1]|uniref:Uncharacterized protein n=1 Tax=Nosema bombycis (strain CQ1 / CVCC 102059) TaxID=578461 RepID=R0MME3_NOSB1|nr:hypothetical protein NBO_42g0013 [Nosema bombycis CQ1]|eukprot:EOB14023.1 hypothetical protein NBO_42g0013 [Nosema bombycis CQ1]